jgi:hypothetical protein
MVAPHMQAPQHMESVDDLWRSRIGRTAIHRMHRMQTAYMQFIAGNELAIFETCAHTPIHESVAEFNEKDLAFLNRQIN